MSDPRTDLDRFIEGMERTSLLAQLRDKVIEALGTFKPKCGNCQHWMKSSVCPRERNVNGRPHGPSMNERACDKFNVEQWVLDLQEKRIKEAVAFAEEHDLPIPDSLANARAALEETSID